MEKVPDETFNAYKKCGCKVVATNYAGPKILIPYERSEIIFCPLHTVAGEMRELIQKLKQELNEIDTPWSNRLVKLIASSQAAWEKGGKGEIMEKLKHVKGPYRIFGENSFDIYAAPHSCANPQCPGEINRRKLEAAKEMARALEPIRLIWAKLPETATDSEYFERGVSLTKREVYTMQAALSAWEKAGKVSP